MNFEPKITYDALQIILMQDNFSLSYTDVDLMIMEDPDEKIIVEVLLKGDCVQKITCHSRIEKNFIPLALAQLQNFINRSRTVHSNAFNPN